MRYVKAITLFKVYFIIFKQLWFISFKSSDRETIAFIFHNFFIPYKQQEDYLLRQIRLFLLQSRKHKEPYPFHP